MALDKIIQGWAWSVDLDSDVDGVAVDYRTTAAVLVFARTGGATNKIILKHLGSGNPDRSINNGAAVRWFLPPAVTATMGPGEWKVYVGNGLTGSTVQGPGPAFVTVEGPPGGSMPLT